MCINSCQLVLELNLKQAGSFWVHVRGERCAVWRVRRGRGQIANNLFPLLFFFPPNVSRKLTLRLDMCVCFCCSFSCIHWWWFSCLQFQMKEGAVRWLLIFFVNVAESFECGMHKTWLLCRLSLKLREIGDRFELWQICMVQCEYKEEL